MKLRSSPIRNSVAAGLCFPVLVWATENNPHSRQTSKESIENTLRAQFKDETITVEEPDLSAKLANCALVVDSLTWGDKLGSAFIRMHCKGTVPSLPFYIVAHGRFFRSMSRLQSPERPKLVRQGTRITAVLVRGTTRIAIPVITLRTCAIGNRLRVTTLDRKKIFEGRLVSESEVQLQ